MLWRANCAISVSTISDMSLHHCWPEYFCMARFNLYVIKDNTLSQIFEKHPRGGGLGTYVGGAVSWDRWTCVLGPLDLCPGTAAWVVSERVGVSSVGVSGVSDMSDVSECRSLTLLTLDRHDARVSPV